MFLFRFSAILFILFLWGQAVQSKPGHKLIACFEKGSTQSGLKYHDADTKRCCEHAKLECRYRKDKANPGNVCLDFNYHDVDLPANATSQMDECCKKAGAMFMKIAGFEDNFDSCK